MKDLLVIVSFPRVKLGLGKTCKGRKNPRGLIDQFTNTVQYSTVQ